MVTTILFKFIWQPCIFFLKTRAKALDAVSGKGAQIRIEMIPIRIDDPDLEIGIGSFQISRNEIDTEIEMSDRDRKTRKSDMVNRIKNLTPLLL